MIEKALDQDYDVLADYGLDGLEGLNDEEDEGYSKSKARKGRRIKEVAQFYDERWSKKRMISDLGFSPKVGTPFRPIDMLLKSIQVPRASASIIYQESVCSTRSIRSGTSMEYAPAVTPRIHFPRYSRHPYGALLTFSSVPHHRGLL